jgi:protein involved in polysaccharide export with SLBB domain
MEQALTNYYSKMTRKKSSFFNIHIFLAICFLSVYIWEVNGQENIESDRGNFLGNRSLDDTKGLQKYYKNVFDFNLSEKKESLVPSFDIDKEELLERIKESIPQEGPINPDYYIVGPGDLLEIDIWGDLPLNFMIPVTPEGLLIIPNLGIIEAAGRSLSEIKSLVNREIGGESVKSKITTTLIQPRIFSVTVSGLVNNPGSYFASSVQRADQVIYLANFMNPASETNLLRKEQREKELLDKPQAIKYFSEENPDQETLNFSLRNILIIREGNDTLNVDLVRYYASGNKIYNPYLRDGDRIIVPNEDLDGNSITISGAVKLEGTFEYSSNDSLMTILEIAQGTKKNADLSNVDIFSFNSNRGHYTRKSVDMLSILKGLSQDVPLMPGDRIIVREKESSDKKQFVEIRGEVLYPGVYPILADSSTVIDLIDIAGGFSPKAFLPGAKIIRNPNPLDKVELNPDYTRLAKMRLSDMNYEDREYYNMESAIRRNYVSIDFQKLFAEKDSSQNIFLESGDLILVPRISKTVYVFGQIANPGYMAYVNGLEYEDYISMAGGVTEMADQADIRIIKAGNQNWVDPSDTQIEIGDAIWIPRVREKDFEYYFNWFARIVAVLGGIATIILLVTK